MREGMLAAGITPFFNRHQHGAVPKLGCADNFRANRPIPNFHNLPRGVALRISNDVREMFVSSR
jgi:hypothetical protein